MILDRFVIAGLTWTAGALMGSRPAQARTGDRDRGARAAPKRNATVRASAERDSIPSVMPDDVAPAETQLVIGPDQDLLDSLNIEESMGYGGLR